MTNKSISQLTAGTNVASTDLFPDVQTVGVGPVKVTAAQIGEYVLSGSGLTGILPVARGGTGLSTMTAANNALYSTSSSTVAAGTLPTAAGGTGLTTFTAANNAIYSSSSSALTAGTLPVAAGGTGLTSLTAGYIPFGNGTSAFGSSANLFWDSANARLGVGTSSPSTILNVYSATSADTLFVGDSAASNALTLARYIDTTGSSALVLRRYRGTLASPSAVQSGDQLGNYAFSAFGGTNNRTIASIRAYVDTYTSDTNISSYLQFSTSPSGSATQTETMRIDASGNVGIGTSSPSSYGKLAVYGGTATQYRATGDNMGFQAGVGDTSNSYVRAYNSTGSMDFVQSNAVGAIIVNNSNPLVFNTGSSERMRIDSSGNVGIGTSSFGTSAATVLGIKNGTAPTTGPADTIQLYSTDLSAGNTMLSLYTEGTPVNANTTAAATHRIAIRVNGTVYYLLANTAA